MQEISEIVNFSASGLPCYVNFYFFFFQFYSSYIFKQKFLKRFLFFF